MKKTTRFFTLAVALASLLSLPATLHAKGPAALITTPEAVVAAYQGQRSNLIVELSGVVQKNLKDDTKGSPHQRFLLRLANGHTLLVAHNIALAPRVPLQAGDQVSVHGEYEWNNKGGVVHWTHHDPKGRHPGGWIRLAGKTYQ